MGPTGSFDLGLGANEGVLEKVKAGLQSQGRVEECEVNKSLSIRVRDHL